MLATKTLLTALAAFAGLAAPAQIPNRFDVVITEIMADPTPVVGLPNAEYLELKNVSAVAINLLGWKISDAVSTATISAAFVLQPDSLVILCSNSRVAAFSAFGKALGVSSFPSLDNDGDVLTLRSPQNRIIHAVAYAADWYQNEAKKEGGWSLEMIDPRNPCTGKANWKASTHPLGGTPGKTNAVNGINTDDAPPQLKKAHAPDSLTLVLQFDEPLDSSLAATAAHYHLPGFRVLTATPLPPLFQSVQLKLATPLQTGAVYRITVSEVTDCRGNRIGAYNEIQTGRAAEVLPGDIVINEILFHPKPGGYDYVELFNRSPKIVDAATLYLANRNSSNLAGSLKKIAAEPFYLFPGDYLVLTENKFQLEVQYLVKNPDAVWQLSSLPSYPNDKGTVLVQSTGGAVIDEVSYHKSWHFALINNDEGVALERIAPGDSSQKKSNWHSAASTAGYGTPGYQNSQYAQAAAPTTVLSVFPPVISPDNDGRDDFATIRYQVAEKGFVANVLIFNAAGRLVRQLVKTDLLAQQGSWTWDGLGENRQQLPMGTYIVFTEIFNLEGKKKHFKHTVVLARQRP